jgi:hypothetical protein
MANDGTSRSWWQTVPGIITGVTGLVTAIGGLLTILLQAGVIGPEKRSAPNADQAAITSATPSAATSATPSAARPSTGERSTGATADVESRLERANIQLSTGTAEDSARVRAYLRDPDGAYARLAEACLDLLAGRRLKRRGHLDMIDKWYTLAVGQDRYLSEGGTIRVDELPDAIVKATNEIHGTAAISLAEIVEESR